MSQHLLLHRFSIKRWNVAILYMYFVLYAIPIMFPLYYQQITSTAFVIHPVMAIQQRHQLPSVVVSNKSTKQQQQRNSLTNLLKVNDTTEHESTLIPNQSNVVNGINSSLSSSSTATILHSDDIDRISRFEEKNTIQLSSTSWMSMIDSGDRSVAIIQIGRAHV